jgi:hypothetical protein
VSHQRARLILEGSGALFIAVTCQAVMAFPRWQRLC